MRFSLHNRRFKLNRKKMFKRLGSILLLTALVFHGLSYFLQQTDAGPTSKPNVFIYKDSNSTSSSADNMATALGTTDYNITKSSTLPATMAEANAYDAIIFSSGSLTSPLSSTEIDWLANYLDGAGKGHLILEGEQIVDDNYTTTYSGGSKTVGADLLKLTGRSNLDSSSRITVTNSTHPVTYGISTSRIDYSRVNDFRGFSSSGTNLAKWNSDRSPQYVLSAWEGTSRRRLVLIGYYWNNWLNSTARNTLIRNAVKWVSDFVEVQMTDIAPAGVNPGTSDAKMAKLMFSSYANSKSSNTNTITSFSVYQTGTAAHSSVKDLKLYNSDASGNLIGNPISQTIFDSNGKATFTKLNLSIGTSDKYYVIAYDIADPADEGRTVKLKLGGVSEFVTMEGGTVKVYGTTETTATTINNITPPAQPSDVYANNLQTGTSVRLGWKANKEWDLQGYKIYRAVDSGSGKDGYSLLSTTTQTTYDNTSLTEFYRYYYKVTAYDIAANESVYSDEVMVIPNRPPATPTGLSVSNPGTGHKLDLTWDAVTGEPNDPFNGSTPDLAGYYLYASINSAGPYGMVNSTPITGTSYTHTGIKDGVTYYYKIASVDRYNLESGKSAYVSATPSDSTPPIIISHYPAAGQDYVEPNVTIKVKFDELLDTSDGISSWMKLEQKNMDGSYTQLGGTVRYNPSTYELTFDPDADLTTVGSFRVSVKGGTGGVKSYATVPYLSTDEIWTFGTLLNPHADFETNNTLCGYCHSAHSATGAQIMRAPKVLDLCFMCHDGTGAAYDVKAGRYFNGEKVVPMAAGGYDLALGSTSTHFTDISNYVYGSPGYVMNIDCISCHEPHGSSNYRNIRTTVNGEAITLTAVVYGPAYSQKTVSGYEITTYVDGWEEFCGTCHGEYQTYHSVTTITGEENWRHRTGMPLTGGSTGGRWVVEFPTPGLYTTLPTLGAPTGANISNYTILPAGTLSVNTYNYIVTAKNAVGESVYGSIMQVQNTTANAKVKIIWDRIENAYKYRIYRYTGTGDPTSLDISQFAFLAEVPDSPQEFIDDGSYSPQTGQSPPTTSNAKVTCITCHYVHGTPAVTTNGEPTRLRRYDNDGICQDCHKR